MLLGTGVTNGNLRPETCAGRGFFLPICRCCQSWAIVVPFGPHYIGPLMVVGHENLGPACPDLFSLHLLGAKVAIRYTRALKDRT